MHTLIKAAVLTCVLFTTKITSAQGRFKPGIALHLITNNYEVENLQPYTAFGLHASYRFIQNGKLSFAVESGTSLKLKMTDDGRDRVGFITTLPVLAEIDMKKVMLYIGTGPGYVYQKHKQFDVKEKASYAALSNTAGIAFKGRSFFNDVLYPEYNIRVAYLNSLDGSNRAAYMLSFVAFLRSVSSRKHLQPVG